ncbi:MAG: ABC transporter permease [Caldilineaceae bacterium]|nr:ABC transporter permease [Caldilineaceae bacterium]
MNQSQALLQSTTADAPRARSSFLRATRLLLRRHPIGALGGLIVVLVLLMAIFASSVATHDPAAQEAKRLLPPSIDHFMGTDELGRDVFSRVVFAARTSLYVGVLSVSLAIVLGVTAGVLAGYFGGKVDSVLVGIMDILFAFPTLVLAIVITGLLGPSLTNAMLAIGVVYSPTFARVARGSVLSVKNEAYIEAAHVVGGHQRHIILRHVLPNIMAPLVVMATLSLSLAILAEAGLSFLGLGTQPPDAAWGLMLSQGRKFMEISPGLAIFPGLAIMITVLAFNFLGDGLRDALDPRLRE